MPTAERLVELLGEENLVTLHPDDAELLGLSAADTETLVDRRRASIVDVDVSPLGSVT